MGPTLGADGGAGRLRRPGRGGRFLASPTSASRAGRGWNTIGIPRAILPMTTAGRARVAARCSERRAMTAFKFGASGVQRLRQACSSIEELISSCGRTCGLAEALLQARRSLQASRVKADRWAVLRRRPCTADVAVLLAWRRTPVATPAAELRVRTAVQGAGRPARKVAASEPIDGDGFGHDRGDANAMALRRSALLAMLRRAEHRRSGNPVGPRPCTRRWASTSGERAVHRR